MKSSFRLPVLFIAALSAAAAAFAASQGKAAKKGDAASGVPADYPIATCVVSDEKLGGMGKPYEYVHKEAGKPDRSIFLCCDGCVDDFKKEPAKYLKILDDAAKAKAKGGKGGQKN